MKKITTQSGVFGPFHSIDELPDRYRCDSIDLPFTVVGSGVIADAQAGDFHVLTVIPVPQSITMRQARLALLGAGLLDNVSAVINSLPEPTKSAAMIEWEYASEVQRTTGLVASMGAALGLTEAQLDSLFIQAAQI